MRVNNILQPRTYVCDRNINNPTDEVLSFYDPEYVFKSGSNEQDFSLLAAPSDQDSDYEEESADEREKLTSKPTARKPESRVAKGTI